MREATAQPVWIIGTWDAASFFMLQPRALLRPDALFTRSGKQKSTVSQLQARRSGYKSLSSIISLRSLCKIEYKNRFSGVGNQITKCQMS